MVKICIVFAHILSPIKLTTTWIASKEMSKITYNGILIYVRSGQSIPI